MPAALAATVVTLTFENLPIYLFHLMLFWAFRGATFRHFDAAIASAKSSTEYVQPISRYRLSGDYAGAT